MRRWLVPLVLAAATHAAIAAIPVPEPAPAEPSRVVRVALRPPAPAPIEPAPASPTKVDDRAQPEPPPLPPPPLRGRGSGSPGHGPDTGGPVRIETEPAAAATTAAPAAITPTAGALDTLAATAPPPPPPAAPDPDAIDAYAARVRLAVERHKRYPRRARSLGHEGTATVTLTIAADGSLAAAPRVNGSSGSPLLDAEAERMAAAAAPFATPPDGRPLRVAVPVDFALD